MNPSAYVTIFEVGLRSFPWLDLLQPLVLVVAGLLTYRFSKRQFPQIIGLIGAAFGALVCLLLWISVLPGCFRARQQYHEGHTTIVEGVVENFDPVPALGPPKESFTVEEVKFSYEVASTTPCFSNKPFRRGPVHAGLYVRIHYFGDCIQRVELRK
jgi:hypothetical protein